LFAKKQYRLMKHYLLTFIWAIIVLILCLLPPNQLGETGSMFEGADKLVHTGFFFVFGVLMFHASIRIHGTNKPNFLILLRVLVISIAFALFTEFLQWKVFTYRTAEVWDLFANFTGIGMACFAYLALHRFSK